MEKYLKNSFIKSMNERKEYYLYDIPVYILNSMPDHIDIDYVLDEIKETVPYEFLSALEGVYVGEFPELKERDIQAMLKDDVIYLSSFKDYPEVTEEIVLKDIIHEVAHLVEKEYYYEIYGDSRIEDEYIGKKKRLVDLLRSNDVSFTGMGTLFFSDEAVDELDDFLYKQLGYDNLIPLTTGLFTSPYSVTSIREYFANGFEEYLMGDRRYIREISPNLYKYPDCNGMCLPISEFAETEFTKELQNLFWAGSKGEQRRLYEAAVLLKANNELINNPDSATFESAVKQAIKDVEKKIIATSPTYSTSKKKFKGGVPLVRSQYQAFLKSLNEVSPEDVPRVIAAQKDWDIRKALWDDTIEIVSYNIRTYGYNIDYAKHYGVPDPASSKSIYEDPAASREMFK